MAYRVLSIILVVLLAGCSGFGVADQGATEPLTSTAAPTETPAKSVGPTEPPSGGGQDAGYDNPWNKRTVSVALSFPNGTANETRHDLALENAIDWANDTAVGDYPVRYKSRESGPADINIVVKSRIESCGTEVSLNTFKYCSPVVGDGDSVDTTVSAEISSRFDQQRTITYYRAVIARLSGVSDPERYDAIEFRENPALYDPFPEHSPVPVRIVNAPARINATEQTETAIRYWEHGDGRNYREYTVDFEVRPNETDAPLTIRYVSRISNCGNVTAESSATAGCAPVINPDSQAPAGATIEISTNFTAEDMQQTLIHEFGHVYGRTHGQEPTQIMSAKVDMNRTATPNVTERDQPWESNTVLVYTENTSVTEFDRDDFDEETTASLKYINAGADGRVPESIEFRRTNDKSQADVVINQSDLSDAASVSQRYGKNLDTDPSLEYYTEQHIVIAEDTPIDHFSYHIAYWLISSFVSSEEDMPEPLDTVDDDREHWEKNQ